jgi:hypothetical protein
MMLLALLLASCEGYTTTGSSTSTEQGPFGGSVRTRIKSANGIITEEIEIEAFGEAHLDADVTLSVGQGTFKIELLGEDGEVTLTLEASDGQTVSGHGQMVENSFGEASYRVTATDAKDVEYTIDYTFR